MTEEQPEVRQDRKTLSASDSANAAIDALTGSGWFADGIEAYRVAVAYALAKGLGPTDVPERVNATTKYNVGSVDPEGRVRNLIGLLRPEDAERPYATAEWLAEAGLARLVRELDEGSLLSEILQEPGAHEGP